MNKKTILILILSLFCHAQAVQAQHHKRAGSIPDYWLQINDTTTDQSGYRNLKGDTVIPLGKYSMCFTDTFRNYAIVSSDSGFIAINRRQQTLYHVFEFDNGPDYPSEGLFRIIENGKIGYASAVTGRVVIKPQFGCAYPFEKGRAEVGTNCSSVIRDEHSFWLADSWFYIDKTGKRLKRKAKNQAVKNRRSP